MARDVGPLSEAFSFLTRPVSVCVCVCFWWVYPGFGEKSIKKSQLATKKEIGNQQTGVVSINTYSYIVLILEACATALYINMCFRSTQIFYYSNVNI